MAEQVTVFTAALNDAFERIRRTIPKMGTDRPRMGHGDLIYERCGDSDWVDGFWSGQLWLAYADTDDSTFLDAARAQAPYFHDRLDRPESHNHDLGFLYSLSLVADYTLTGDQQARAGAQRAAESLAGRFNSNGQFIRAWNAWNEGNDNRGRIIIDCMENLGLLFWASEETGDPRFREIAVAHAHTTARHIIRADGSSYHTFLFDPDTGEPLRGETVQGYADESCWSRGQAWAIHGYAIAYAYTGETFFRDMAMTLANYALARLPVDRVPIWDYRLPASEPPYRDTSAGAIMAAGLFALADQCDDATEAAYCRDAARAILTGLIEGYTTAGAPEGEGLLVQGASHVAQGLYNHMLPYGDYFFIEALLRALGRQVFFW